MKKTTTTLRVPVEAATLEDIAADFERRAAEAAQVASTLKGNAFATGFAESRTWQEAARILRNVAAAKAK